MQRLRTSGTSIFGSLALPCLKKKAWNSWSAVQDTYFSTRDVFERHRVVFTVSTSIATVVTTWAEMQECPAFPPRFHGKVKMSIRSTEIKLEFLTSTLASEGYSLRYHHQSKVEERLSSIEKAMTGNHHVEHEEIKKIVNSGNVSSAACVATAGATFILGYGLGWRGGKWYANRKFRKEQMKLLGQIKPSRWQALQRRLARSRTSDTAHRTPEVLQGVDTAQFGSQQAHQS